MSIRSRSAKGELERMRKEMDRIWDRFSQEFSTSTLEQDWNPALDLTETESSLVAEIEVPGINPDNIDISITADVLTFTGEKKKEAEEKKTDEKGGDEKKDESDGGAPDEKKGGEKKEEPKKGPKKATPKKSTKKKTG